MAMAIQIISDTFLPISDSPPRARPHPHVRRDNYFFITLRKIYLLRDYLWGILVQNGQKK